VVCQAAGEAVTIRAAGIQLGSRSSHCHLGNCTDARPKLLLGSSPWPSRRWKLPLLAGTGEQPEWLGKPWCCLGRETGRCESSGTGAPRNLGRYVVGGTACCGQWAGPAATVGKANGRLGRKSPARCAIRRKANTACTAFVQWIVSAQRESSPDGNRADRWLFGLSSWNRADSRTRL